MLQALTSRHPGEASLKGNQPLDANVLGEPGEVAAAPALHLDRGMPLDFLLDRTLQMSAEHMGFGMEFVRWWFILLTRDCFWCFRPSRHFVRSPNLRSLLDLQFE